LQEDYVSTLETSMKTPYSVAAIDVVVIALEKPPYQGWLFIMLGGPANDYRTKYPIIPMGTLQLAPY
jgi:hypothetical protein